MREREIFQKIEKAKNLVLATHQNPDIDGLSSMLAFALLFPEKELTLPVEELPVNSHFLHGIEKVSIVQGDEPPLEAELLIIFDAQCEKRLPDKVRKILKPKEVLVFDHHQEELCGPIFDKTPFLYLDPEAPSTTYLLYQFFKKVGLRPNPQVAENLLAGLYYDTGSFRYENVKGDCFLIAHELLKLGARPSYIARELYENIPLKQIEITKVVLERLEFLAGGHLALSYLTKEDFQRLGGEAYLNDPASFLRSIEGVKISALIKEVEEGLIKVSLRSKAPVVVLPLAKKFGGGGHLYACGFKITGKTLKEFLEIFKEELVSFYEGETRE